MKNILNDFKGKVLEEVQNLIKEIRYISCNYSKELSALLTRTNSTNRYTPFLYADSNFSIQRMYQVLKCFKFPQAD